MRRYIITFLLTSLALPMSVSGAAAEPPRVVTDLPPVHSLVAQVMEGVGEPELLLDQGADAHSFQLRPSQAGSLSEADLVVWIGPEMTPWLERALESLAPGAAQLDLIHAEGTRTRTFGAEKEDEDHDHAHDHGHDHSGTDPHAWLDPNNAHLWLGLIAGELSRLDPENSAIYSSNASKAQSGIQALDAELEAALKPIGDQPFVVFHDAYGYFTEHYGLKAAMPVSMGDASAPGAAHLADLRAQIADAKPYCMFPEAQHDRALVQRLVEESGSQLGADLDPEGSTVTPGPEAYALLMRGLANALTDCLGR